MQLDLAGVLLLIVVPCSTAGSCAPLYPPVVVAVCGGRMDGYFQPLTALTDSRRPIYTQHEIELAIVEHATLHVGSASEYTPPTTTHNM